MKRLIPLIGLAVPLFAGTAQAQTLVSNLVVGLDPANTMAFLTVASNPPSEFAVKLGSNMVLRLDNPLCTGTCTGDLNYLRVTLAPFSQDLVISGGPGGTAHVNFDNPTLMIVGPVPLQSDGLQFIVPIGTTVSFTATISGTATIGSDTETIPSQLAGDELATTSPLLIGLDVNRQLMSFNGTFPFDFQASGTLDGVDVNLNLPGSVSVIGVGLAPFADVPPVAVATAPATAACGAPVMLDGSQSTDGNGPQDIVFYNWERPDGTLIASGKTVTVTLPPGTNVVVLHVVDTQGIEGTAQVTVQVAGDSAPVFAGTPLPVVQVACGAVTLTPPVATSACGFPVTVTSNAPAFFRAGRTTVTWTARSSSGLTSTTTQVVVAQLGDDPACCPAGTHVILGTSNDDVLVGTSGNDCIIGRGGQDTISGLGGDDIISGGDGDDHISGGPGNDVINGGSGQDVITGDDGNDVINGGQGDDTLNGGNGDDILNGGGNNDHCTGGPGFDLFFQCIVVDTVDVSTAATDTFNVCQCHPTKCQDCATQAQACQSTPGCPTIIGCVAATPGCHQPNECSQTCENGLSQQAIAQAGLLASCLGGCQ